MSKEPIKFGIVGLNGRMGQAIAQIISADPRAKLMGGVVREVTRTPEATLLITHNLNDLAPMCDVILDFSSPDTTALVAQQTAANGKALMCGTTGLDIPAKAALQKASEQIPVLYATNTSLSLVVMKQLVQQASALLRDHDYDISIHDAHHRMKKDAPSGTAKTLGEFVLKGNGHTKEPSYSATRAGFIIGEHEVLFAGNGENITLTHTVTDRTVFARGAFEAGLWLFGRPAGTYTMDDTLKS